MGDQYGVSDVLGAADAADAVDDRLLAALDKEAGRAVGIGGSDGRGDVVEAEAVGDEPRGVDADLILPDVAAEHDHLGDAGDREQAPAQGPVGLGAQVHRIVCLAGQGDEHDLAHDRGHRREDRRLDFRRERITDQLQALADDLAGPIWILPPLELDPDHGDTDRGRRAHAADPGGAVERGLNWKSDLDLELLRGHAVGLGEHGDGRRGQVGEDVDGHAPHGGRAPHDEHERGEQHQQAIVQRPADDGVDHRILNGRARGSGRHRWRRPVEPGRRHERRSARRP